MENDIYIEIQKEFDIIICRRTVRDKAMEMDFGITDQTRIVTATSELARNIFQYAGEGKMIISVVTQDSKKGIKLVFEDTGPGFDPDQAMVDGYTSKNGLGLGLSGSKRLMDDFHIQSEKSKGTTVIIIKWLNGNS